MKLDPIVLRPTRAIFTMIRALPRRFLTADQIRYSQPTVMRDKNRSTFNSDRQTDQFSVCLHHSQIRIGRMIDCIVGNSQHCDFLSFNVLL